MTFQPIHFTCTAAAVCAAALAYSAPNDSTRNAVNRSLTRADVVQATLAARDDGEMSAVGQSESAVSTGVATNHASIADVRAQTLHEIKIGRLNAVGQLEPQFDPTVQRNPPSRAQVRAAAAQALAAHHWPDVHPDGMGM